MATCKNGHYYPDDKAECPYCPRPAASTASTDSPVLKTQIGAPFGAPAIQPDHTRVTPPIVPKAEPGEVPSALRTQIGSAPVTAASAPPATNAPRQEDRRLMGWLVSFDQNPMGTDYQLREGRNIIGTAPDSDIALNNDPGISGKHLTILFRLCEVLFKDELSTNGTWINGKLTNEGQLQDGDEIKLGATTFLYRSAHPKSGSQAFTKTGHL